jgi:adenine deaminase
MGIKDFVMAASGRIPADLVIKGARVVNVFTGEVLGGSVAVFDVEKFSVVSLFDGH